MRTITAYRMIYDAKECGRNVDLHGENLKGIYLIGENLFGANLNGANLRGAKLSGANLSGVKFIECTNRPKQGELEWYDVRV